MVVQITIYMKMNSLCQNLIFQLKLNLCLLNSDKAFTTITL